MKTLTSLVFAFALIVSSVKGDIVIQATSVNIVKTNGSWSGTGCGGSDYAWIANYRKTIAQGWGWKPDTNNFTTCSITDTNRSGTRVEMGGKNGDDFCGPTTVSISNSPPFSAAYRFTVYGTNLPASSNLVLHGFLP